MSSRGSTSLAGSLAPSAWQRELAQNTVWVNALRSTYSWTRAFTAPQPMLNNEPLLGQSLALLTTATAQPPQNASEALRPTRLKPARVQDSTNHESFLSGNNMTRSRRSKADHVAQQPTATPTLPHVTSETPSSSRKRRWTHQATTIAQTKLDQLAKVDQRVDEIQLHQWAGTTVGTMNYPRTVTSSPAQGSRHQPHPQGTREGYSGNGDEGVYPYHGPTSREESFVHGMGAPRGYPGGAGNVGGTQPYQHSLIEQTRRMLQHTYQPLSMDTEYQPIVGHAGQEELLLSRQWATTIGEQIAPLELLQHYAALSRQDNEAVNRNGQNKRTNASTLSPLLPEDRIPSTTNTVGSTSNHAERMQTPPTEPEHPKHGQRASDYVEQESTMPPQVAAQLPSLITSQRIDMPPLPIAAATARFGARAEMMIDEDLDVLAAKIKRILDDEARRHGIDV